MKLFDLPYLSGYKTALAGWALLLVGVGNLTYTIGMILLGEMTLESILPAIQQSAAGLAVLGIGHKAQRLLDKS